MEIKDHWDEVWTDLEFENLKEKSRYKISNYGRIVSYFYNDKGDLLKLGSTSKYKSFSISDRDGKKITRYVHRLVAQFFLKKPTEDKEWVIHLDNNKHNNYYKNLRWVTKAEKGVHQLKFTPGWKINQTKGFRAYSKLTESQVKLIKRKINDPNRKTRMKIIAKRYGVSVMQLYRIKSGENWSTVSDD